MHLLKEYLTWALLAHEGVVKGVVFGTLTFL